MFAASCTVCRAAAHGELRRRLGIAVRRRLHGTNGRWISSAMVTCPYFRWPDGLVAIRQSVFHSCTSLVELALPAPLTTIGQRAFHSCISLSSLTLPASLATIDEGTFHSCTSLVELTLPASLATIEADAFHSCAALVDLTLPASLTTIGEGAFEGCSFLSPAASDAIRALPPRAID